MPRSSTAFPSLAPALALTLSCLPCAVRAQDPVTLDRIQVTATRAPQGSLAVPAAVSVVDGRALHPDTSGVGLADRLQWVPGVLARDRHNLAQDEQLSIRGFGTRSSFGIRGVRLYIDGIPATMPDGQGQLSHAHLATAERVEVLRGPFSALYGNASGGVIQVFTADGRAPGSVQAEALVDSDGQHRLGVQLGDAGEHSDIRIGATRLRSEGAREHSRAQRDSLNAKANLDIGANGRLSLVANALWAPDAQDPQGLTRTQFDTDPRQASAGALAFDTRKSVRQRQLGAVYKRDVGASQWRLSAYEGRREVEQFLSIPVGTQRNPLSGGGVINLDSPYSGAELRWTRQATLAGAPLELTIGLTGEAQRQTRRGYENFVGDVLGVRGALRLAQDDRVSSFDQYTQALWRPTADWSLMAGVRHSRVSFTSNDRYITARNPDDSGRVAYGATSPVLGANLRLRPGLHAWVAAGEGFETPAFNELGYRSDGGSGPNLQLHPAHTRSAELGLKLAADAGLQAELALFRADTRDELAVATSAGGRTTYQNAGRARREGAELAALLPLGEQLQARLAITWIDARYVDGFLACAGVPCTIPDLPVSPGTRIPGVPRTTAAAALQWGDDLGWQWRLDGQYAAAVPVSATDAERAGAYVVFGASAGYGLRGRHGAGRVFAGVANLADRRYAGSVIVNESNGRYYEPAPGRLFTLGLEWRWGG